jgi:hypothetical protein
MYYTGWGFRGAPGSTSWALGLAESFDGGTTWRRAGEEPVLERGGPGSSDAGGACVPTLMRVGDRWMMWYTAGVIDTAGRTLIHLCLATSDDGLRWRKHPDKPVLGDDFSDGAKRCVTSRCCVRLDEGVFRMWYSHAKPDYRIRYAESLDGVTWERSPVEPALGPSPSPAWDDTMVEYPEVDVVDGVFRLWFCGNNFGSVGYAEGRAKTGVRVAWRSGESPTPDGGWSPWTPATRGERIVTPRYAQVRAELWSQCSEASPRLNRVGLSRE